nr:TfoX/Sxy family DNA transformation protein [uncultured Shinella sp.]
MNRLEELPNIGPYLAARLVEIDITTPAALRELGAVEAYARLKFRFSKAITLHALWAMDAALSGIDWRHLPDTRKQALKARLTGHQGE